MPQISVILPVYNGMKYLQESVNSVLGQELDDFEFLVVDDCSTDGCWEFLQTIRDVRFTLYRNASNKGLFYNLNFLIGKATSPLIKLWSQDDVMFTGCLQEFVSIHHRYPALGFSYCATGNIDESGNVKPSAISDTTPEIISPDLHARIAFYTGSIAGNISNVCLSRQAIEQVGLFNEQMKISGDFDMWVRIAKDHDTGRIAKKLVLLRDHSGQLSRNESLYIHHVKEDLMVYRNLFNYVSPGTRKVGRKLLRNNKFVFYYTLMVKEFMKGRLGSGIRFLKVLSSADNFLILTTTFIKAKVSPPGKPRFLD